MLEVDNTESGTAERSLSGNDWKWQSSERQWGYPGKEAAIRKNGG